MEGRKEGGQEGRLTVCGFSLEVAFSFWWLWLSVAFVGFSWLRLASVGFSWLRSLISGLYVCGKIILNCT